MNLLIDNATHKNVYFRNDQVQGIITQPVSTTDLGVVIVMSCGLTINLVVPKTWNIKNFTSDDECAMSVDNLTTCLR